VTPKQQIDGPLIETTERQFAHSSETSPYGFGGSGGGFAGRLDLCELGRDGGFFGAGQRRRHSRWRAFRSSWDSRRHSNLRPQLGSLLHVFAIPSL
jgi:hypothetical protein